MIRVADLIGLLQKLPSDALCQAYEGEDIGITIRHGERYWWIRARQEASWLTAEEQIDSHTEGFE